MDRLTPKWEGGCFGTGKCVGRRAHPSPDFAAVFLFLKKSYYLFRQGEGREKERERNSKVCEIHQLVALQSDISILYSSNWGGV